MAVFTDRNHQPTSEEVRSALGSKYPLWQKLIQFVEAQENTEGFWTRWGPKGMGWNLRFRWKGSALVALYPHEEDVIANVVLGTKQAESALALGLGEKVADYLAAAPQLHDGRWLFIPVSEPGDAEDIEQLLRLKMGFVTNM